MLFRSAALGRAGVPVPPSQPPGWPCCDWPGSDWRGSSVTPGPGLGPPHTPGRRVRDGRGLLTAGVAPLAAGTLLTPVCGLWGCVPCRCWTEAGLRTLLWHQNAAQSWTLRHRLGHQPEQLTLPLPGGPSHSESVPPASLALRPRLRLWVTLCGIGVLVGGSRSGALPASLSGSPRVGPGPVHRGRRASTLPSLCSTGDLP